MARLTDPFRAPIVGGMPTPSLPTFLLALAAVAHFAAAPAAGAEPVDNPVYVAWAKCKPGTTVTSVLVLERGGQPTRVTASTALVEITPERASLDTKVTAPDGTESVRKGEIAARVEADAVYNLQNIPGLTRRDAGKEDFKIDGVTYSCRVIELTGELQGAQVKATVLECLDVPGAIARMTATVGENKISTEITGVKRAAK